MVNWDYALMLSCDGGLYDYMKTIPKENWNDIEPRFGGTLLHYACRTANNNDAIKALILNGANVNATNRFCQTPLIMCVNAKNLIGLKILYKSGVDITARCNNIVSILELSLAAPCYSLNGILIVKFLIAHGFRLKNVQNRLIQHITTSMRQFESGVLKCRRATIAMLHSKRKLRLAKWDKFMLAEMANYIWATRNDPEWQ